LLLNNFSLTILLLNSKGIPIPSKFKKGRISNIVDVTSIKFIGLPDNKLDSLPLLNIIQPIEELIFQLKPTIIYTHHCSDLNVDHSIVQRAVLTACRPVPGFSVKNILTFEIVSSTDWSEIGLNNFRPNTFINITKYLNTKIEALNAYSHEMRASPHSRSLENITALARNRGHTVGVEYAEAFYQLRQIID
jgi:LmbE family N-acetylglucosaminyl deacetylase